MNVIDKIVKSNAAPVNTNVVWLNTKDNNFYVFDNGWKLASPEGKHLTIGSTSTEAFRGDYGTEIIGNLEKGIINKNTAIGGTQNTVNIGTVGTGKVIDLSGNIKIGGSPKMPDINIGTYGLHPVRIGDGVDISGVTLECWYGSNDFLVYANKWSENNSSVSKKLWLETKGCVRLGTFGEDASVSIDTNVHIGSNVNIAKGFDSTNISATDSRLSITNIYGKHKLALCEDNIVLQGKTVIIGSDSTKSFVNIDYNGIYLMENCDDPTANNIMIARSGIHSGNVNIIADSNYVDFKKHDDDHIEITANESGSKVCKVGLYSTGSTAIEIIANPGNNIYIGGSHQYYDLSKDIVISTAVVIEGPTHIINSYVDNIKINGNPNNNLPITLGYVGTQSSITGMSIKFTDTDVEFWLGTTKKAVLSLTDVTV